MEMLSTTIPDGDEGPVEPLESTAGEIRGPKSRGAQNAVAYNHRGR